MEKENIANIILHHCAGLYEINIASFDYATIKPCAFLSDEIPEQGNGSILIRRLILDPADINKDDQKKDTETADSKSHSAYGSFARLRFDPKEFYSRNIVLSRNDKSLFLRLTYLPDSDGTNALLVLTHATSNQQTNILNLEREKVLSHNYLYSMFVNLDTEECSNIHISEIPLSAQDNLKIRYTEWQAMLYNAISPDDQGMFLKYSDIDVIRNALEHGETHISFNISMETIAGAQIWSRHAIQKVPDYSTGHLDILYTVQDVSYERKLAEQKLEKMEEKYIRDSLTNTLTRSKIESIIQDYCCEELSVPVSIICFTMKSIPDINAVFYHQVSDSILVQFSHFLMDELPDRYLISHYSMASFVCVCRNTGLDQANTLAQEILLKHKELRYPVIEVIHLGVGVIQIKPGESFDDCILRLDKTTSSSLADDFDSLVTETDINTRKFEKNADIILNKVGSIINSM